MAEVNALLERGADVSRSLLVPVVGPMHARDHIREQFFSLDVRVRTFLHVVVVVGGGYVVCAGSIGNETICLPRFRSLSVLTGLARMMGK